MKPLGMTYYHHNAKGEIRAESCTALYPKSNLDVEGTDTRSHNYAKWPSRPRELKMESALPSQISLHAAKRTTCCRSCSFPLDDTEVA